MDELPIRASTAPLSTWPDDHVRRAYGFAVRHLMSLLNDGCVQDVTSAEEEAAMFGEELLRRGLL